MRFQRQKAIDNFIVGFYCGRAKLVVELDGGGHFEEDVILSDEKRTGILKTYGLSVIRFSNLDIDRNFEGICDTIDRSVKEFLKQMTEADPSAHDT